MSRGVFQCTGRSGVNATFLAGNVFLGTNSFYMHTHHLHPHGNVMPVHAARLSVLS